jgi:hypothetical protein
MIGLPDSPPMKLIPDFFNCGEKGSAMDFYMLGIHFKTNEPCLNETAIAQNGVFEHLGGLSVPSFLRYGCQNGKHDFAEVQTIYGEQGSKALSGMVYYEWLDDVSIDEDNGMYHYPIRMTLMPIALVEVSRGSNITLRPNYLALLSQMEKINPSPVMMDQYTPTNTPPATCSQLKGEVWQSHLLYDETELLAGATACRLCCIMRLHGSLIGMCFQSVRSESKGHD